MPVWDYDQKVRIVTGKHAGKVGLLKHVQEESRHNMRAEVETPAGGGIQRVFCDLDDLESLDPPKVQERASKEELDALGEAVAGLKMEYNPEEDYIGILLMLPEDEHAAFNEQVKDYQEGES